MPEVGKLKNIPSISKIIIDCNGVLNLSKQLDVHKAMGPYCIPNIVLKNGAEEISQGLSAILQCSLNSGILPSDWRNTKQRQADRFIKTAISQTGEHRLV